MLKNCKLPIILCAIILSAPDSIAQEKTFTPYLGIGVHSGITISDVKIDQGRKNRDIEYSAIQTNNMGIQVVLVAEKYAGIQLEANLATNGWNEVKDSSYN